MSQPDFSLFVSSVSGRTVFRYGTKQLIGAKRRLVDGAIAVEWIPEKVVPLTRAEAERYAKEYGREIRDGALVERKREEWEAQLAETLRAEAAAQEGAKKSTEAAAQPPTETP